MSADETLYPVNAPGFEGRGLGLRYTGWLGKPRLFIDGKQAQKTGRGWEYRLVKADGTETMAVLRARNFGAMMTVTIEDHTYHLPSGLAWAQWLWAAVPLLLSRFDLVLGGLLGAVAMVLNLHALRSEKPALQRYLLTLAISAAAVLLFVIGEALVTTFFLK